MLSKKIHTAECLLQGSVKVLFSVFIIDLLYWLITDIYIC